MPPATHRWTVVPGIAPTLSGFLRFLLIAIYRYHRPMAMDCGGPDMAHAVALFRSLGNPARLAIVTRLAERSAGVRG